MINLLKTLTYQNTQTNSMTISQPSAQGGSEAAHFFR